MAKKLREYIQENPCQVCVQSKFVTIYLFCSSILRNLVMPTINHHYLGPLADPTAAFSRPMVLQLRYVVLILYFYFPPVIILLCTNVN